MVTYWKLNITKAVFRCLVAGKQNGPGPTAHTEHLSTLADNEYINNSSNNLHSCKGRQKRVLNINNTIGIFLTQTYFETTKYFLKLNIFYLQNTQDKML